MSDRLRRGRGADAWSGGPQTSLLATVLAASRQRRPEGLEQNLAVRDLRSDGERVLAEIWKDPEARGSVLKAMDALDRTTRATVPITIRLADRDAEPAERNEREDA